MTTFKLRGVLNPARGRDQQYIGFVADAVAHVFGCKVACYQLGRPDSSMNLSDANQVMAYDSSNRHLFTLRRINHGHVYELTSLNSMPQDELEKKLQEEYEKVMRE